MLWASHHWGFATVHRNHGTIHGRLFVCLMMEGRRQTTEWVVAVLLWTDRRGMSRNPFRYRIYYPRPLIPMDYISTCKGYFLDIKIIINILVFPSFDCRFNIRRTNEKKTSNWAILNLGHDYKKNMTAKRGKESIKSKKTGKVHSLDFRTTHPLNCTKPKSPMPKIKSIKREFIANYHELKYSAFLSSPSRRRERQTATDRHYHPPTPQTPPTEAADDSTTTGQTFVPVESFVMQ